MYRAAKIKDKIIVAKFDGDTLLYILRKGHELQPDGRGKGEPLYWKTPTGAKMYADLLNRGKAL